MKSKDTTANATNPHSPETHTPSNRTASTTLTNKLTIEEATERVFLYYTFKTDKNTNRIEECLKLYPELKQGVTLPLLQALVLLWRSK